MNIDTQKAISLFKHTDQWLVITGAGISAASGIPTYRDNEGNWQRNNPIQHQAFIDQETQRQRYWTRSTVGWPMVSQAKPQVAHNVLSALESKNKFSLLVTQNVDRLHQKAGHKNVIDLHGRLDQVRCLSCGLYEHRDELQTRLIALNPYLCDLLGDTAPDGDAFVEEHWYPKLTIPDCLHCNGVLMPDVVFFGGSVPKERVTKANDALERSQGLLIVGSSMMVYSGYRFCKLAAQMNKPIIIVNQGKTRADDLATYKISTDCHEFLQHHLIN